MSRCRARRRPARSTSPALARIDPTPLRDRRKPTAQHRHVAAARRKQRDRHRATSVDAVLELTVLTIIRAAGPLPDNELVAYLPAQRATSIVAVRERLAARDLVASPQGDGWEAAP